MIPAPHGGEEGEVSPEVRPFHSGGEASAAGPPGTPGMASAEMDLCRGQHWRQGQYPRKKVHLGRKEGKMLRKNPLTAWIQKAGIGRKKKQVELSAELVKS